MTVAATMFAGSASAFDQDDLQKSKDTNACKSCELKSADLYKADLRGADLGSAIMMDIILCNTTMPDGSVNDSGC